MGGNNFNRFIRETKHLLHPSIFVCSLNWVQVKDGSHFFTEPGDTRGELEQQYNALNPTWYYPWTRSEGKSKTFKIRGLKEGMGSAQRLNGPGN